MTGNQFKRWQKRLGLSNSRAAEQLRIQERQIYNYRSGDTDIPEQTARLCELIELCVAHQLITLPPPYVPAGGKSARAVKSSPVKNGEAH